MNNKKTRISGKSPYKPHIRVSGQEIKVNNKHNHSIKLFHRLVQFQMKDLQKNSSSGYKNWSKQYNKVTMPMTYTQVIELNKLLHLERDNTSK